MITEMFLNWSKYLNVIFKSLAFQFKKMTTTPSYHKLVSPRPVKMTLHCWFLLYIKKSSNVITSSHVTGPLTIHFNIHTQLLKDYWDVFNWSKCINVLFKSSACQFKKWQQLRLTTKPVSPRPVKMTLHCWFLYLKNPSIYYVKSSYRAPHKPL
jgi:hypothetical protein